MIFPSDSLNIPRPRLDIVQDKGTTLQWDIVRVYWLQGKQVDYELRRRHPIPKFKGV